MLLRLKNHLKIINKYFKRGLPIFLTGPSLFTKVISDYLNIIVDISLQDKKYNILSR